MKKYPTLIFSLLTVFALAACGKSNNNNGNTNYNDGPLSFDKIESAYAETLKQDNLTLTASVDAEAKSTEIPLGSNIKVPGNQSQNISVSLERDNGNTKVQMLYSSSVSISISDVQKELNYSKYEATTLIKDYAFKYLERYDDYSVSIDEEKQIYTLRYDMFNDTIYQITDPTTKQIIQIDSDGEAEYTTNASIDIVEEMDEAFAELRKGKIEDGKIKYQSDSGSYVYDFTFDGNKLSKVNYTFEDRSKNGTYVGTGSYTFSKINSTSVTVPSNYTFEPCSYDHGEYARIDYYSTEVGHIPTCYHCEKFLAANQPHSYVSNEFPVCKVCGYVKGSNAAKNGAIDGFTVNNDELLTGTLSNGIFSSFSYSYSYYDYLYLDNYTYAYYYDNAKAFLVVGRGNESPVQDGCCLMSYNVSAKLYKNIPETLISQLNNASSDDERIPILNGYFAAHQLDASVTGKMARISHTSLPLSQTLEIDQCHTASYSRCQVCNQVTNYYTSTNHVSELVSQETKIDKCHTKVTRTCPTCGESEYYIETEHNEEHAKTKEQKLDSCHTLVTYLCPDCNEELDREIVAKHNEQSLHTSSKTVDSCTTVTDVTCDACNMIASHEEVSNHKHLSQVVCSYAELSDYGIGSITHYNAENLTYVFNYCSDCHKVDGLLAGYPDGVSISHSYYEYSYYTFDVYSGNYSYKYETFDHIIGEDGLCIFCHAKVIDINDQYQFAITCHSYGSDYYYFDYDLYDKTSGETIKYDYSIDEGTGAYIWNQIPGMSLLEHFNQETYQTDKITLTYLVNGKSVTVEFVPSDFPQEE